MEKMHPIPASLLEELNRRQQIREVRQLSRGLVASPVQEIARLWRRIEELERCIRELEAARATE